MNRSVVTHQNMAWWRNHWATSRCTAGSVLRRYFGRGGKKAASATTLGVMLPFLQSQPDQKAVRQQDGHGMPMKSWPQPPLVLIPAQLALGLFMKLFDGMPPVGIPGQYLKGRVWGQVAPEIFPLLGRPLSDSLPHQPALMTRPVAGHPPTADRHKFLAQSPLRPPPPADRAPLPAGHTVEQLVRPPHGCAPHGPYAERTFRRLNASELLPAVYAGAKYVDGSKQLAVNHQEIAA